MRQQPPVSFAGPAVGGWLAAVGVTGRAVLWAAGSERGGAYAVLLAAQLALPVAALVLILWMPRLVVDDDAVTVRSVLSTVTVPWSRLQDVSTGWFLQLTADGRSYPVRAVPAISSVLAMRELTYTVHGTLERRIITDLERYDRTGGSPVGGIVAQRWAARRHVPGGEVNRTSNRVSLVVLAVSAGVSALGLLVATV